MKTTLMRIGGVLLAACVFYSGCAKPARELERPEKIVSKRQVVYDPETYERLAGLWSEYFREYPSEDAYANWMYAARYAGDPDYESLLRKGAGEYPANPTLAYLMGLLSHGATDNRTGLYYLERAVELDPAFTDAWFGLAIEYMSRGDGEKLDVALRHLLEAGSISDDIMDYSYNMMSLLERDAILVTNGDNDTYPGWILSRIIGFRPDITIVNRSLLNTEWYPGLIQDQGVPAFIRADELEGFRKRVYDGMKEAGSGPGPGGPFGDTLISRLVGAADREGRPVYFAATMFSSEMVDRHRKTGQNLGLVTLVTTGEEEYGKRLRSACAAWLNDFRTAGLDGWILRNAGESAAGRQLAMNYPAALYSMMDAVSIHAGEYRLPLFRWYQAHVAGITPKKLGGTMAAMWCGITDIPEIRRWCAEQGVRE